MAARRKPKIQKLKFELTKSAIGGIAVVAFCLFLWMFLLGVWAGQSLLLPSQGKNIAKSSENVTAPAPLVIKALKKVKKKKN
ncbi:MAG: hypothetical protein GY702_07680 [Desulfobulbaceae bacterium]|nr:hypothetical protein [Desulfobulbaceae bacterium]